MDKKISVSAILKELKTDGFVLHAGMPMGYLPGLPILEIRNEELCLTIPYLKYKVTGQVDKTLVYPIRFTLTLVLPELRVAEFRDLGYQSAFRKIDFTKPVGLFRHEAVKHLTKQAYQQSREELLGCYDKVIAALLYGENYTQEDEARMQELLQMMVEPSLLPIYKELNADFYFKYLA